MALAVRGPVPKSSAVPHAAATACVMAARAATPGDITTIRSTACRAGSCAIDHKAVPRMHHSLIMQRALTQHSADVTACDGCERRQVGVHHPLWSRQQCCRFTGTVCLVIMACWLPNMLVANQSTAWHGMHGAETRGMSPAWQSKLHTCSMLAGSTAKQERSLLDFEVLTYSVVVRGPACK